MTVYGQANLYSRPPYAIINTDDILLLDKHWLGYNALLIVSAPFRVILDELKASEGKVIA